jgi:hypothetical protein
LTVAKPRFVDHPLSVEIDRSARSGDHRTLAIWAAECAERVLPLFEKENPEDGRPRQAIVKLREWIDTGEFRMEDVRRASLNAHAAARSMPEGSAARFAARACGQAMAAAHVKAHSIAAAWYAAKSVWASNTDGLTAIRAEREWQYRTLMNELGRKS